MRLVSFRPRCGECRSNSPRSSAVWSIRYCSIPTSGCRTRSLPRRMRSVMMRGVESTPGMPSCIPASARTGRSGSTPTGHPRTSPRSNAASNPGLHSAVLSAFRAATGSLPSIRVRMRRVAFLAVRGSGGGGMRGGRFSAAGGRAGLAHHRRPATLPKEPAIPSFVGHSLDVIANRAHPPTRCGVGEHRERGLSNVALHWMLGKARDCGLRGGRVGARCYVPDSPRNRRSWARNSAASSSASRARAWASWARVSAASRAAWTSS